VIQITPVIMDRHIIVLSFFDPNPLVQQQSIVVGHKFTPSARKKMSMGFDGNHRSYILALLFSGLDKAKKEDEELTFMSFRSSDPQDSQSQRTKRSFVAIMVTSPARN
jgi:hypothetical protein